MATGRQIGAARAKSRDQQELDDIISKYPNYQPTWDDSWAMTPELNARLSGIQMDPRGLNKFRDEALRNGPSAWANLSRSQNQLNTLTARERARKESAGTEAQARSTLAMRGGLRSGTRERLAKEGMKDYLAMSQDATRQGQANDLQIGINDEGNRIQQLGMLPGMEVAALQPEFQKLSLWGQGRQFDTTGKMKNAQSQNDYNASKYGEYMKATGAFRTAQATENAANKGSWLCTEAHTRGQLNAKDHEALGLFLRYARKRDARLTRFYLGKTGQELVTRMKEQAYPWEANTMFVKQVCEAVREGDLSGAFDMYLEQVYRLIAYFWPECRAEVYLAEKAARKVEPKHTAMEGA
jgi:hypothetical protein